MNHSGWMMAAWWNDNAHWNWFPKWPKILNAWNEKDEKARRPNTCAFNKFKIKQESRCHHRLRKWRKKHCIISMCRWDWNVDRIKTPPQLYFITSNLFRWFKSRSKWEQSRGISRFATSAAVVHDAHRFCYLISEQKARVFISSTFFVFRVLLLRVGPQKCSNRNWKELKCMLRMFCALFYGLTATLFVSMIREWQRLHGMVKSHWCWYNVG